MTCVPYNCVPVISANANSPGLFVEFISQDVGDLIAVP